jgi:hypothetical protein
MPNTYESIPEEQRVAYLANAERAANEAFEQVAQDVSLEAERFAEQQTIGNQAERYLGTVAAKQRFGHPDVVAQAIGYEGAKEVPASETEDRHIFTGDERGDDGFIRHMTTPRQD